MKFEFVAFQATLSKTMGAFQLWEFCSRLACGWKLDMFDEKIVRQTEASPPSSPPLLVAFHREHSCSLAVRVPFVVKHR